MWKGQDSNLGPSQTDKVRQKQERREQRRLARMQKRAEKKETQNLAKTPSLKNAGKPWFPKDDDKLEQLYEQGQTIRQIADEYQRTQGSIKARLKKLGLIEE